MKRRHKILLGLASVISLCLVTYFSAREYWNDVQKTLNGKDAEDIAQIWRYLPQNPHYAATVLLNKLKTIVPPPQPAERK